MNRSLFSLLLLLLMATATSFSQDLPAREHLRFDANWRFHYGHADDPRQDFNYGIPAIYAKAGNGANTAIAPDFVDTLWRQLNLPHDWAVELPFVYDAHPDVMSHGYKPVGGHSLKPVLAGTASILSCRPAMRAEGYSYNSMASFAMRNFG
jgi:beta-galactosidase